jgi:hypothetical protein
LENRKNKFASCGIKCTYATKDGIMPLHLQELFRKHQNNKFDINDHRFPVSICGTCLHRLPVKEKDIEQQDQVVT